MALITKVAVSGAQGFIGQKLCQALNDAGYEVWHLVRRRPQSDHEIFYDYVNKKIDRDKLAACHVVIHLAGKNIAGGLWTKSFKKALYDSRVKSTLYLAHTLSQLSSGPKVLLNASAYGIYGDRADQKLDEESLPGQGFLADLCCDWERSTLFAKKAGIRVVCMRFGNVLDKEGGLLQRLAPLFRSGLGAILGNGQQYMPYVTRDELVAQILFLLRHPSIEGPVNMVSLQPTTFKEFALGLGKALDRPVWLKVPRLLLSLLGDPGKMLLASARVYPKVLLDQNFLFQGHDIEETLKSLYR